MCLAVPMKIIQIAENSAICEFEGITRECDISLIENIQINDFVLIHAGFAIKKIDYDKAVSEIEELKRIAGE